MKAQILKGSKEEIIEAVARINGEIREAIILLEEASDPLHGFSRIPIAPDENIFAEMEPYMVKVGGADYSREALYTPQGDE